jgi:hypothetical protein
MRRGIGRALEGLDVDRVGKEQHWAQRESGIEILIDRRTPCLLDETIYLFVHISSSVFRCWGLFTASFEGTAGGAEFCFWVSQVRILDTGMIYLSFDSIRSFSGPTEVYGRQSSIFLTDV